MFSSTSRFLLGLALLAPLGLRGNQTPPSQNLSTREIAQGYRQNILLAKPRAAQRMAVDAAETQEGLRVREKFSRLGELRVLELPPGIDPIATRDRLNATGRYEFVELDGVEQQTAVPNDPSYPLQWAMNNRGQIGGTFQLDIRAQSAWDVIHDAPNVVVAVLDGGANVNHLDLAPNLWVNSAPTFGDVNGASIVNGVRSGNVRDENGHGTHVAGTIGAVGNNSIAVAGVAWRVQLMILKNSGADGFSTISDSAACIDYAVAHGAHIINCSFGGIGSSQTMLTAIRAAREAGIILVAAAGNSGLSNDIAPHYPANYLVDNVVAVGNSGANDLPSSSSDYGASVELFAPGTSIISLDYLTTSGTAIKSGTSMAAPHVSGALALLKAKFPNDTFRQLINRLLATTDPRTTLAGKALTGGRMNLFRALTSTSNLPFNDDYLHAATVIGTVAEIRSNNAGATTEPDEPRPLGLTLAATLWWQWTAPTTGPVTLDTVGSDYDTVMAVYNPGTLFSNMTLVAANDNDGAAQTSKVTFNATAGTSYYFTVGGKAGAGLNSGMTLLTLRQRPGNDDFANATVITGSDLRSAGVNKNATLEPGEPKVAGAEGSASVWFKWTAPRSGRFQISAFSLTVDMQLGIYTGSRVDALTEVAANNDTPVAPNVRDNHDSRCTVQVVAGTTYYLKIDGGSPTNPNGAEFTLTITDSLWQASTTTNDVLAAPAVGPDGVIYFGCGTTFFALQPNGTAKWTYTTTEEFSYAAAAIGSTGTIFFGTEDGKFYALNPDGTEKWQRRLTSSASAAVTPALAANGTIYLQTSDGIVNALDPSDGHTVWTYTAGDSPTFASATVAADGTIYQVSGDAQLHAINADGTLKWKFNLGSSSYSSPALDDAGNLYIATYATSRVYSISPEGQQRWVFNDAGGGISTSPVLNADGSRVYICSGDKRVRALDTSNGLSRWTYTMGDRAIVSTPAIDANGVLYVGCEDAQLYAINPNGTLKRTWHLARAIQSSPVIFGTTLYVGSGDAKLYAFALDAFALDGPWPQYGHNARRLGRANVEPLAITVPPAAQGVAASRPVTLDFVATGRGTLGYQWYYNGSAIPGAQAATYAIATAASGHAGSYTVTVTDARGTVTSTPAIVGIVSTRKVIGAGSEVAADIRHPKGNVYDQLLLDGAAATFTADAALNQITRLSYVDLTNDIVQVEFSGAGSVSIVLDAASGPALPANYNQAVNYMKGHAGIVVSGANETTNLSVFSVGRANAVNQALFKDSVTYDGVADLAFIAIASTNGKFGGLRTANASYFATRGLTGVYAPGVQFTGPVFVGDINAQDSATPYLVLGGGDDVRVTGGDMQQANGRAVTVAGITQLKFTAGGTSHGGALPAQANKGRFEQNGTDVTAQIVVNP